MVGRSADAALRLAHPTVSRRHATVTHRDGGLAVEDHDSRHGTFVNGARVRAARLRPGDLVRFGAAAAYRVEPGGLRRDDAAEGVTLVAEGLALAPADARGAGAPRPLVEGLWLAVRPGAFLGLIGPSGAGKSTVLACLAGRLTPAAGRLGFDGGRDAYADPETYRALLGLVPQDDVVYPGLTARENLEDAARIRLGGGPGIGPAVEEALGRVGLAEHAAKPAGILSGGQRKRLSVAIELLRRPRLLLLDEPTSGLDPAGDARLIEGLSRLARQGTTVVCTTHQMENLGLFDEVAALGVVGGVGRLAYRGPPEGLLAHFGRRSHADLYEALDAGEFEPIGLTPPDPARDGDRQPPPDMLPVPRAVLGAASPDGMRAGAAEWGQAGVVARRDMRLLLRDRGLAAALFAQPVALGLLVCLAQYDADKPLPLLSFLVVVAIWLGLNGSARDLVRERRNYARDRLAGLRPGAYLGAKAAVHAAVGAAQVAALLVAVRLASGVTLRPDAATRLAEVPAARLLMVLLACHLGGVGMGLLASTLARTEESAVAALPLLILPQLLLGVVATGAYALRYDEERPFRPIVATLRGGRTPPGAAALVDGLSMACLSRPATLVAEAPRVAALGRSAWLGDACHLAILVLGAWSLLLVAFARAERRWIGPGAA
ncbi:MAG TPA: ATP-binding cassette domain-containing protein [Isosphaeraceae bacterium]|nr:ATP-binding cassette domain-containing protein [Isosphaeraceae bacterium]